MLFEERFDALFGAVKRDIDSLGALVEERVKRVNPAPVLRMQPPSTRHDAARSLETAGAELEIIAEACRSASQELAQIMTRVERSKHDSLFALTPVCALPDEILAIIFTLAIPLPHEDNKSSLTSATRLTHVCTYWSKIARGCSALWADFCVDQLIPRAIFDGHLRSAKQRPLTLVVRDRLGTLPLARSRASSRWLERVEDLTWTSCTNPFFSLSKQGTIPRALKTFTLRGADCAVCGMEDRMRDDVLNDTEFPVLRSMILDDIIIEDVGAIQAPALISLSLVRVEVTATRLGEMFDSLPMLEVLTVEETYHYVPIENADAVAFSLPRLHTLTTRNLATKMAFLIMKASHYPALRRWQHADWLIPHRPDSLQSTLRAFVAGAPHLEHLIAQCGYDHHAAIFSALDSDFTPLDGGSTLITIPPSSPSSPAHLKTLHLSIPRQRSRDLASLTDHQSHAAMMLKSVEHVLQHRQDRGLPDVEKLVLHRCPSVVATPASLRRLAKELVFEECAEQSIRLSFPVGRVPSFLYLS